MAKGALRTWPKSDDDGANVTGCGAGSTKPAIRNPTISTTLRMVENSWKVEECLMPVSCTSDTSQTTPIASASGGAPGTTALPYWPNAIAASATGAAKPTVADTHPARKPKAG